MAMIGDLFDSPWKILIVALVIIVLFGSKKLPSAARSLGQSMRILKKEVQGLHEDEPELRPSAPPAAQAPAELTASAPGGQSARQAQIGALQRQIRELQGVAAVDAEPQTAAAAAGETSRPAPPSI
jgi:sec-independent protein translocase protein TatA